MELNPAAGWIPSSARSLAPFRLTRPANVREAVAMLDGADETVLLAGGTDLVAKFNEGLAPKAVVDMSGLAELRDVRREGSVLHIGSLVTHHAGSGHPAVHASTPGFAAAWTRIANPRIRFRATLGGNLMARRTRYEGAILLTAMNARAVFATRARDIEADVPALWQAGAFPQALLTSFRIDAGKLLAFHYERSLRPMMTQALALFRDPQGLKLSLAIATEYLQPVQIEQVLPGLQLRAIGAGAGDIARDVLARLPSTFFDPIVTVAYARRAGRALLERQLSAVARG